MMLQQSRTVNLLLIGGTSLLALALFIAQASNGENIISTLTTGVAALVMAGLFGAYWWGRETARYAVVVLTTLATGLALPEPYLSRDVTFAILVAPVLALILTSPGWVLGSLLTIILCLAARAGWTGIYTQAPTLILLAMLAGGIVLSRLLTDAAQRAAEANAKRAEEALGQAQERATEIEQQATEMLRQLDEQRRLLDLVNVLETPIVALAEGVLLAPVVGHLDSRRASDLTDRLLRQVSATHARLVILDITGVPTIDTGVAKALIQAVQAVRLLGCEVTVTGISASIAATVTQLGINMASIRTVRTPHEALQHFLAAASLPAK